VSREAEQIIGEMRVLLERLGAALGASDSWAPPGSTGAPAPATGPLADLVYHAPAATYRVKNGITLAIDGEKPHWITTNAAGAMLLRGCTGENTLGELAGRIAQRYGIAAERALADASAFLQSLEAIDYVRQSATVAPAYRGRSEAVQLGRLADIFLFVTNDCNLRCTHCYVSSGDYVPPREMTTAEILGLIDQARELGVGRFLMTGGEPFMVKDIYEIIRYITAESDLVVLTNGMYFTERNLVRLKDSMGRGQASFQVSLDGPTAELHDAIRGAGAFDKSVAGVKRAIESGFDVAISTAVSLHTLGHMAEMTRLVGRLRASAHHILWMQEWGRAIDNNAELMIPPERVAEVMRECKAVGDEIGVTIDNDASLRVRVQGKRGRKTDLCSCGWDSLAVFSDGQVYPCVWLAGAPGMECGSVLEQPLGEIWRGAKILDEIRGTTVQARENCAGCHLKFICAGGSPCSSHFASLATRGKSDIRAAEPYCETYKQLTHDMLWELGLAGAGAVAADGTYEAPRLINCMDGAGAHCARPNTVAVDGAFEVGSYHCVCVLEGDVQEGVAIRPVLGVKAKPAQADPHNPTASFDAVGHSCVDLLLPMSKMVRALAPGQVLRIQTDDIAAREDLASWCRMTGNELVDRVKADGLDNYYVRRGEAM
jgi:radical SAM protein with 4Fe4S-binding SPASM domain